MEKRHIQRRRLVLVVDDDLTMCSLLAESTAKGKRLTGEEHV